MGAEGSGRQFGSLLLRHFGLLDQLPDLVLGGERNRDQRAACHQLAFAHPIERGLDMVGEGGDPIETEHRAGTLDRVQGTERGVQQIGVLRRRLQVEQRLLELLQQLRRFLAVGVGGIGLAHAPSNLRITATNWSCWNGLVIQPVAPAFLACCFIAGAASVVRKTIGTPLNVASLRNSPISVRPSITGMLRSVSTRSTVPPRALANPSAPSRAWITW